MEEVPSHSVGLEPKLLKARSKACQAKECRERERERERERPEREPRS